MRTTMRIILVLAAFYSTATAHCACGYTVNSTSGANHALFTELLETDFLHLRDLTRNATYSTGWLPQNYNTTALDAHGPYGEAKENRNIVPNYIPNHNNWADNGVNGGDAGLQLYVRSQLIGSGDDRMIPSAEVVSERDDILYGSFRIAMKTIAVKGTCSAFFTYRNDSQEVDLEILSSEQNSTSRPVHFVIHGPPNITETNEGTIGTQFNEQHIYQLAEPGPDGEYNEYRFDWLPGRVDYYINGDLKWSTTKGVPNAAGSVHLSHWSNGNPLWSGGPPEQDVVTTVSYVKAYFNSTDPARKSEYRETCSGGGNEQMCEIPSQMEAPNPYGANGNETGKTFFFTLQANSTPGQVVYNGTGSSQESVATGLRRVSWVLYSLIAVLVLMF